MNKSPAEEGGQTDGADRAEVDEAAQPFSTQPLSIQPFDLMDKAPCGFLLLGPDGKIAYLNQTLADWLELPRPEIEGRLALRDILSRAGWLYVQTHLVPMLRLNGGFQEIALALRTSSGVERLTLVAGRQVDDQGRVVLIFAAAEERARIQDELATLRKTAQTRLTWLDQIERMANIGAWSVDLVSGEITWSDQVFAIHDLPVGPSPSLEGALAFFPPEEAQKVVETALRKAIDTGASFEFEATLNTGRGGKKVRSRGGAEWEKGRIRRLIGIFEDMTAEAKAREDLWRAAHIDELSGLANRGWFRQCLTAQLEEARAGQQSLALMQLDLDHFKEVNDVYGHMTGDAVIRIAAQRIAAYFGEGAIVGRNGGDEFTVALPGADQTDRLEATAQNLAEALGATIHTGEAELQMGVSIGIARFPQDATTLESLVRCADTALLHAKQTQKGGAAFFDWHIRAEWDRRRLAVERVRQALSAGQVVAHYQPCIHLATGTLTGYEALARIQEPDGSFSTPADWGMALEDPDCARRIDRQVLRAVIADWPRLWPDLKASPGGRIGLNTSEYSLKRGNFVPDLLDSLHLAGLSTSAIEIEVLETVVVGETPARLADLLAGLRRHGVSIALDDFGTGFASLRHLRDLPIDRIKLDRSFMRGLGAEDRNRPIVQATVDLAHALGLGIVAEGVETLGARDFLRSIGCDEGQGYLFGRPAGV